MKKLISIVIPAYNEEKYLVPTVEHLWSVINPLNYRFEIILVNDGSRDNTWEQMITLTQQYKGIKAINLSRNFGKEIALTAGLEYARGDAVIIYDADGQYPADKIADFVSHREQGYAIVYNKRPAQPGISRIKSYGSKLFYRLFRKLSEFEIESNTTDYRLMDRKVIQTLLKFKEKNRMFRGLVDRVGFTKIALVFDTLPPPEGRTPSYSFMKLTKLAIDSITSFSAFPLKLVSMIGIIIMMVSLCLMCFIVIHKLLGNARGFTNLGLFTLLNTFFIGIMMTALGLIAVYIARIHDEVMERPLYIVADEIG